MVSRETKLVVTLDDLCDEFIHTKVTLCGTKCIKVYIPSVFVFSWLSHWAPCWWPCEHD